MGVSLGTSALASESANVVLVRDNLLQILSLVRLGQHTVSVITAGVTCGMGCSFLQMLLAAAGVIPPVLNACLQEVVDLSSILNSLRLLTVQLPDTDAANSKSGD